MTYISDIFKYIDSFAPYASQMAWDNSGLSVGSMDMPVERAVLALDITDSVIDYAASVNAQLIITHHPSLFHPIKSLSGDSIPYKLARLGISALCAHTNLDAANGGVNDVLCELLGLSEVSSLCIDDSGIALARIGTLKEPVSEDDFALFLKQQLGCCAVIFNKRSHSIRRVAVIGGGGGEYFDECKRHGADALVTGDAKHHEYLGADSIGITLFTAGHYATEFPVLPSLQLSLCEHFPDVEFIVTQLDAITHCC